MFILYFVLAYLSGSIPFGWILSKFKNGKDLRKVGSGATGATNTLRVSGLLIASLTAILDVSKAFLPTLLVVKKEPDNKQLHTAVGTAALVGHTKSVFLGFKGGKAVSPAAGVLLALATKERSLYTILLPGIVVMTAAITLTRGIVSVGSLLGSATAAGYTVWLTSVGKVSKAYCLWVVIAAIYIWIMHKPNIERLFEGKENRISLGS